MKNRLNKFWLSFLAWFSVSAGCDDATPAREWLDCRRSSCWDRDASMRMMNIVSPRFPDSKAYEYFRWQAMRDCDHIHVLLVNGGDGEGSGYDCLLNPDHRRVGLHRVREARAKGFGVVMWVVADDSDTYRRAIFAAPEAYANALADYFQYASYIVLGLEMDEGYGTLADWTALRDAIIAAGWRGPIATHHKAGRYGYAHLGGIVMDQLSNDCTPSDVVASVTRLRKRGYAVCGFEYARNPNREKAQAAFDAGAFGCGNW